MHGRHRYGLQPGSTVVDQGVSNGSGPDEYVAVCKEANPQKAAGAPKPRLELHEMQEKTVNHVMLVIISSCLFSNMFLEDWCGTRRIDAVRICMREGHG